MMLTKPDDLIVSAQPSRDDLALARFEALAQSQQPATQPWQPVTDYSFEARTAIEGDHPRLILEAFQPTRILDVGCGSEAILLRLLRDLGGSFQLSGIDKHPRLDAQRVWPYVIDGDISEQVIDANCDDTGIRGCFGNGWAKNFNLVICREVLEHLTVRQIRRAVTNLCTLSSQYVYVTTRFAKAPTHLLGVDTSDDLDPDHRTMLNQNLLRVLFVLEGFKRRPDLEQRMDHMKKGRVLVYERGT